MADIMRANYVESRLVKYHTNTEAAKQYLSNGVILLKALRQLQDTGPVYPSSGICYNVGQLLGITGAHPIYSQCIDLAKRWPNRWPNSPYHWPVAGNYEPLGDPAYAAWDASTQPGRRRHELLGWMIGTLTKELQHGNMV